MTTFLIFLLFLLILFALFVTCFDPMNTAADRSAEFLTLIVLVLSAKSSADVGLDSVGAVRAGTEIVAPV